MGPKKDFVKKNQKSEYFRLVPVIPLASILDFENFAREITNDILLGNLLMKIWIFDLWSRRSQNFKILKFEIVRIEFWYHFLSLKFLRKWKSYSRDD